MQTADLQPPCLPPQTRRLLRDSRRLDRALRRLRLRLLVALARRPG